MPQLCKRVKMCYLSRFLLLIWQMHLLAYMKRTAPLVAAWVPVTAVAWVPVTAVALEKMLLAN